MNSIFADTNYDADFLTPSYVYPGDTVTWPNGAYAVVWTAAKGNDTSNITWQGGFHTNESVYAGAGFPGCGVTADKMGKANQNDLWYLRQEDLNYYADVPWDLALWICNQIRAAIDGVDFRSRSIQLLNTSGLSNYTGDIPAKQCNFYLAGEQTVNPWTACFAGVETGHTADLTFATDSAALGCNKWMRVTNHATGLTVVGRATDDSPVNLNAIEGTSGGIGVALKLATACTNVTVEVSQP